MSKEKKSKGDRIVQIILLILIAAGIASFPILMGKSSSAGGGMGPGGPGGAGMMPGADSTQSEEDSSVAVEVQPVERGTVQKYIKVNGDVASSSSVDIFPDIDGKLVSINVGLGDYVRKGSVLAYVDPSQPGKVYSKSAVRATVSGTITEINFDEGETVSTSSEIATIGDLDSLQIETFIPERYVQYVKMGLVAEVSFDAYPDVFFEAQVSEISPVLDTDSRSQEISLSLLGNDKRIKVGMFASMKLIIKESIDVIVVSGNALSTHYDDDVVYVVKDGKAERRTVTLGLSSSEEVEIINGLSEGDVVITRGLSNVSDGTDVRVVE
ncbi:MAG: efflux RND transporter periplasmic adaptor subunit [Spirochaetales bacterium]|nr:efflux RND transporter periplasmic adaptor subunit [Spirochaetales bacterium]